MVRAAARGALDFRSARLQEPNWWRKVTLILDEIEAADAVWLAAKAFLFHMLTAANGSVSEAGFKSSREAAHGLFKTADGILRPWAARQDDGASFRELYRQTIGDYQNDPAFRAAVDAEAKAMRDAVSAAAGQSDEEAYAAKLRARLDAAGKKYRR